MEKWDNRSKWRLACAVMCLIGIAWLFNSIPLGILPITFHIRHADDAGSTVEMMRTVANSSNAFGIDLYNKLNANQSNIFFSPWSISSSMMIVREGARGQTADEIASVFYLGAVETWRPNYAGIYNVLHNTREYTLRSVNALWYEQTRAMNAEYVRTIDRYYCGDIRKLDFLHQPDAAGEQINNWVEEATEHKIQDIVNPCDIQPSTPYVITNALYFAAAWKHQFDPEKTGNATFYGPATNVTVPFMRYDESPVLNYTENDVMQMVELPYKGGQISMFVVLPKQDMTVLGTHLSTSNLTSWENGMVAMEVDVRLPSFTLEATYDLKKKLIEMGMPAAFSLADLSGIDGGHDTFLEIVTHKAFISVDELGTEAAAATVVIPGFGVPLHFTANHPFFFYIRERITGAMMFIGAVQNPAI